MKHNKLKFLMSLVMTLSTLTASSSLIYQNNYAFEVDGVYYSKNGTEATVVCKYRYYDNEDEWDYEPPYQYESTYSGNVTIPSTVTFNGTTYSVTSISHHAFVNCKSLTGVTIPNSITSIGEYAFQGCSTLMSLTIPNSVTTIGYKAFEGTAWYNNQQDGVVYAGLVAYTYKGTIPSGTSITLRDGTKGIANSAFYYCRGLRSVTIPNSVTHIGSYAFNGCSGLTGNLTIPNSVTHIGSAAFFGCSGLTGSLTIPNSVTFIGSSAFSGCSGLTGSLTIPNSVTTIGGHVFEGCSGLTGSLTIPNSVTSIGPYAFCGCSRLTGNLIIPNSVTSISYYAFNYCTGLTSVDIPNSVTYIGSSAFESCTSLNTLNYNAVSCDDFYCDDEDDPPFFNLNITTINIGDSVRRIPEYFAFGLSKLTSLTIGKSVGLFGNGAFVNCTALKTLNYNAVSCVNFKRELFSSARNSIATIVIGDSVKVIPANFAYGFNKLTNLTIPNSVTFIGSSAFSGCSGLTGSLTIPSSVTTIGDFAFNGCSGLTGSLTIPNSVTTIGSSAFSGCSGLTGSLTIPNSVTSIGSSAFSGCSGLMGNLTIPNSVTTIGDYAFNGCRGLTGSLTIPNSVTTIGSSAFFGCSGLTGSLTIPNSVTTIGSSAFNGCSGLTSMTIGNSVTSIGNSAFLNCSGLTNVTIPNSVTTISDYAFQGCTKLDTLNFNAASCSDFSSTASYRPFYNLNISTINIGDNVQKIPAYFAYGLNKLTIVTIPNSVTTIGSSAFFGCSDLTSMTIGNSVTSIGNSAFMNCSGLTSVTIPNSVTTIGSSAFYGCSDLTSMTIGNSVTSIEDHLFESCTKLKGVTIPNSVTSIGNYAFSQCSSLSGDVNLSNIYEIGNFAFNGCSGLTGEVNLPNASSIGDYAFNGCSGLTSVKMRTVISSVGNHAFYDCPNLSSVTTLNTTPPTCGDLNTFNNNVYYHALLFVPKESVQKYIVSDAWGQFINIIGIKTNDEVFATDIMLDQSSASMYIGTTLQLNATVLPDSTTNKQVKWRSSNEGVAMVDSTGLVTAFSTGNVMIIATTSDGTNLSAACEITVNTPTASVDADDFLFIQDIAALHGDTIVIPVTLNNEDDVIAFQTDVFLPDGFEIVQEDGEYVIDPSERITDNHIITSRLVNNASIRVLCYSPDNDAFTGNSGDALFYITVAVPDDAVGDYTISLRNTRLTLADFAEITAPDTSAVVTVMAFIPGDANDSRTVTVTDIVTTVQYILDMDPNPFIFASADMNADEAISITDVALIAYLINHPTMNAPKRMPVRDSGNDRMSGEGVTLMAGETRTVSILLDNETDYTAFQMDLTLPEGLTASNFQLTDRAGNHAFDVNAIEGNKLRALCYSPAIETIEGHDGALLTFGVTATGDVKGNITVDGIELVTVDCQTVLLSDFTIGVNTTTSLNELNNAKAIASIEYFNLAGQRIDRPESGVTLVVTTYTDGTRTTAKLIK